VLVDTVVLHCAGPAFTVQPPKVYPVLLGVAGNVIVLSYVHSPAGIVVPFFASQLIVILFAVQSASNAAGPVGVSSVVLVHGTLLAVFVIFKSPTAPIAGATILIANIELNAIPFIFFSFSFRLLFLFVLCS
jgi:hypothetical protein